MRPQVVLHNAVSVNGMLTGFDVDMALYYELAGRLGCDASLVGSGTIMAAPESRVHDDPTEVVEPSKAEGSMLVVADGRGRVRCWGFLRRAGFWGRFASLACAATPPEHLDYLRNRGVEVVVAGDDRVDLHAALDILGDRFGIRRIRTDSGGVLNAALLRLGLIDEISLLVSPRVVSASAETALFAGDLDRPAGLQLRHEECVGGGEVWLRYDVLR